MAKTIPKYQGGYTIGATDQVTYETSAGSGTITIVDHANVATSDTFATLQVLLQAINESQAHFTAAIDSSGYVKFTAAGAATWTGTDKITIKTSGAAGGLFATYFGADLTTGQGYTRTSGNQIATFDDLSARLFRPTDATLTDDQTTVAARSIGTEATSGQVVTTYLGHSVTRRTIRLLVEDADTWPSASNGTNNLYSQFMLWAQGIPFSLHPDRTVETLYSTSNTTGYKTYRMDPTSGFAFQPQRAIPGVNAYWTVEIPLVEVLDSEVLDESEV